MAQLQNLVLTDRATTPVNHTFTPKGRDSATGVATVVESSGVPIGENKATLSYRETASKKKARFVLTIPIVATETINGVSVPKVVRATVMDLAITYDPTSTLQERKDAVGMLQSALAPGATLVNDTIVNLNAPW